MSTLSLLLLALCLALTCFLLLQRNALLKHKEDKAVQSGDCSQKMFSETENELETLRSQLSLERKQKARLEQTISENECRYRGVLKTEEQLQDSIREKEVLLKEIHHRVKNNLQIISSLLSLQSRHTKDKNVQKTIKESQNRVKSIALVHEMLYQSSDLGKIDLEAYFYSITNNLLRSYQRTHAISVTSTPPGITIGIDTAIPCGLIVNELVTNSMLHGFSAEEKGEIEIELSTNGLQQYTFAIRDTGRGFPEGMNYQDSSTLGLRLVRNLVKQINGKISFSSNQGAIVNIEFQDTTGSRPSES